MRHALLSLASFFLLAVAVSAQETACKLTRIYEHVDVQRPITIAIPKDGTQRLFLVQQRGQVRILPKDEAGSQALSFLDISNRHMEATEESQFEEGLVGFAFHPKFAENGKFYLYYTQQDPKRARLSEMRVSAADPNKADPATERVLLEVPLPYWNHHSGNLAFGPDGLLYFTIGDGGGHPGGDPLRLAQNVFVFNGKVLRIDVDKKSGAREYGIPADNPFAGKEASREEIYAYGMRNPWGLSFDEQGTLWCADVGQDLWEEIDHIENGGNYGWSFREGKHKFALRTDEPPSGTKFVEPIFEYDHTQGLSITGGLVYRGHALPGFSNAYIYGDWAWGRIWALKYDKASKKVLGNDLLFKAVLDAKSKQTLFQPTCFCEDANREILALDWNGRIFRLENNRSSTMWSRPEGSEIARQAEYTADGRAYARKILEDFKSTIAVSEVISTFLDDFAQNGSFSEQSRQFLLALAEAKLPMDHRDEGRLACFIFAAEFDRLKETADPTMREALERELAIKGLQILEQWHEQALPMMVATSLHDVLIVDPDEKRRQETMRRLNQQWDEDLLLNEHYIALRRKGESLKYLEIGVRAILYDLRHDRAFTAVAKSVLADHAAEYPHAAELIRRDDAVKNHQELSEELFGEVRKLAVSNLVYLDPEEMRARERAGTNPK